MTDIEAAIIGLIIIVGFAGMLVWAMWDCGRVE